MGADSGDARVPDPLGERNDPANILVKAYFKSLADWERMLTAPQPPGRLLAIGAGLGSLEGLLLGGLQGGREGAIGGTCFGLFLGIMIAVSGWRLRTTLRNLALAMFLGLLVEAIGGLILGRLVHLNARGDLPGKLDLRFLKTMLYSLVVGIAVVAALFSSMLANLRRSVIMGTSGAVVGGLASLVFSAMIISSASNCPGFMIPIVAIVFLINGVFFGFIIGAIVIGILGAIAGSLRRLAGLFRDHESTAMFTAVEETRRSSQGPASPGGSLDRSLAPAGQEPLPRWVPQRVQIWLWANWIQLDWFIRRPW